MKAKQIPPIALRYMLDDGCEIALIDVREEGVFARDGHILLASNVALSHLEMRVPALLPRKSVRIVVCDGGEGLTPIASARLTELGYGDVSALEGGVRDWASEGFRLYTGVYVPSKAFGEYILHEDSTPEVTVDELAAWKKEARDVVILDSRPLDEFRRNSIPGAIDCPGAELIYRTHDLVRSAESVVVVNCGGRTRSIIGAQALINAGLTNPVFALKDGTQGWHLAGYPLEHGCTDIAPAPSAMGVVRACEAASRVARRFGVRTMTKAQLKALQADTTRTVYVLDVRSPDEFAEGHLQGSLSAPGGQLVQATDVYLGVRHATVVLIDEIGVRATITASWLAQMGWQNVFVLKDALTDGHLEVGAAPARVPGPKHTDVGTVSANELHDLLGQRGTHVVDLADSLRYSEGHIPGAWHVVRSRLRKNLAVIPRAKRLVFTSPDDTLARFAAQDALQLTGIPIKVLQGGTEAWCAAGYTLEQGTKRFTGPADDLRYKALDQPGNVYAAIREYLQWEIDLVNAVQSDPDFGFRRFAA